MMMSIDVLVVVCDTAAMASYSYHFRSLDLRCAGVIFIISILHDQASCGPAAGSWFGQWFSVDNLMRSLHAIIHYVNQTCDHYRKSFAELIMEAPIAIIPVLASVIVR